MSIIKLAAGLAGVLLLCTAQAQTQSDDLPAESSSRMAPRIQKDPVDTIQLPGDLPAVAPAHAMTGYLVPELSDRQTFAFDPASFRLSGKIVMLTITATSKSGASTSGYYAVNCDDGQYRLLGFPSAGKWKSSTRSKWRKVSSTRRQLSQLVPLHEASCKGADRVVSNATDLTNRLEELSDRKN